MKHNFFLFLGVLLVSGCMKYTPVKKVVVETPPVKPEVPVGELSLAAGLGDTVRMQKLIDDGADVNEVFELDGMVLTPVMIAIAAGKDQAAQFLISKGAHVNLQVEGVSLKEIVEEQEKNELAKVISAKEASVLAQ